MPAANPSTRSCPTTRSGPTAATAGCSILTFKPSENKVYVHTYSPTRNAGAGEFETDANSQFMLDVDLAGGGAVRADRHRRGHAFGSHGDHDLERPDRHDRVRVVRQSSATATPPRRAPPGPSRPRPTPRLRPRRPACRHGRRRVHRPRLDAPTAKPISSAMTSIRSTTIAGRHDGHAAQRRHRAHGSGLQRHDGRAGGTALPLRRHGGRRLGQPVARLQRRGGDDRRRPVGSGLDFDGATTTSRSARRLASASPASPSRPGSAAMGPGSARAPARAA